MKKAVRSIVQNFAVATLVSATVMAVAANDGHTATPEVKTSDTAAIRQLFADYVGLMNDKDSDQIARRIYAVPVLYHLRTGEHVGYADTDGLANTWKRYIDSIETKLGPVGLDIVDV